MTTTLKRLVCATAVVLLPTTSLAASIVTWEAGGVITRASTYFPGHPSFVASPPVGTPYSVELQFDPSVRTVTGGSVFGSPCYTTPASGTFNLGGVGYSLSGAAFTHSQFPETGCAFPGTQPPGGIEFFLDPTPLADDPWQLSREPGFLMFSYFDAVFQDGTFPESPTPLGPGQMFARVNDNYEFSGPFVPQAVDQTAAVPEPATMTLFGLGLAAIARKVRRRHAEPR